MDNTIRRENIAIVLNRPRYPENIGAAARSMKNMGINELIVVAPENFDKIKILKMATHFSSDTVEAIKIYDTLEEALDPFNYIVGLTARIGRHRQAVRTPAEEAAALISISQENRIAVLFGSESKGLFNDDIKYCHSLVHIPTAEFSSINLAQAVMIMCYEIFKASKVKTDRFSPRLATRHELEGMYGQLKDVLTRISFFNPENPDYWLNNVRIFFDRLPLRAKEVSIIRGVCSQIDWYADKRYHDGLRERIKP